MSVSGIRVLRMMDAGSVFKLLLLLTSVAWCGAKHITIQNVPTDEEFEIQDTIKNIVHTGIYSHLHLDTSQVQVVTPTKVTRDGEFVSHEVEHSHEHGHARARRDLHGLDHKLDHMLHYNINVDGRELRLDLRPSVTFITPSMVVERHYYGERTRSKPDTAATACHYTGSVRGQPASEVVLSACDGLAGLLRTEHGEYWIEPSNHITEDGKGRAHVIFKRSALNKAEANSRSKRSVNSYERKQNPQNLRRIDSNRRNRENKEAIDRQRREYLEERRRKLESLRLNPTEYRRYQARLRLEKRRLNTSRSNLVENSKSLEGAHKSNKNVKKTRNGDKPRRTKGRRRGRRRANNNCATKQPPYEQLKKKEWQMKYRNKRHNDNTADGRRSTRSVSKPRHVEVLLVADKSMDDFHRLHENGNLETYLLTIMNMVSSLYMDPSIGNYIKVVVVKIILIEDARGASQLRVTANADNTLTSFCTWQNQLNPAESDPHHHDVAILVTRQNICSKNDSTCSTLGVAHVAGMCKPDRSCSVNEDNGITLAHTITHELGHNFGLFHDTQKIGCFRRIGTTLHIMTPIFEADTVQVAWSTCSKRDVTNFLDAGLGECLNDTPSQEEYIYPVEPAASWPQNFRHGVRSIVSDTSMMKVEWATFGVLFNATTQCHLQFGGDAEVCASTEELCTTLWCQVNGSCKTLLRPAAPGTTCGENMWCINQTCVARGPPPDPRDGGWGPWTEWSECSRTCGAGVKTKSRKCNNPEPLHNGKYCIGDRSRYEICNTEPCSITEPAFRDVQCAKLNGGNVEWTASIDQDKLCDLQCVNPSNEYYNEGFVADGTPCRENLGARDMCIAGICYKVGCDWKVNSNMEEDECGVCGGNGTSCQTVQGIFSKPSAKFNGYTEVAEIPAGSKNVNIQEKVSPDNFISIGTSRSRERYLKGTRNMTKLTEYFVAGAQAIYERDRDFEKIRIPGPLAENITIYQRVYKGEHRNPGVTYNYTVDRQTTTHQEYYSYILSEWTPCSATCGVGYKRRHYKCIDESNREVDISQCYNMESPRYEPLMQKCQLPRCTNYTYWWVGSWNPCSKPCHMPGQEAMKQRRVYCVDKILNSVVDDAKCDKANKPITAVGCPDVPPC